MGLNQGSKLKGRIDWHGSTIIYLFLGLATFNFLTHPSFLAPTVLRHMISLLQHCAGDGSSLMRSAWLALSESWSAISPKASTQRMRHMPVLLEG